MTAVSIGDPLWRKSSASNSECVEVAAQHGYVLVRDSRDPAQAVLVCPRNGWRAFLRDVKLRNLHDERGRVTGCRG